MGPRKSNRSNDQILVLDEPDEVLVLPLCEYAVRQQHRGARGRAKPPRNATAGTNNSNLNFNDFPLD